MKDMREFIKKYAEEFPKDFVKFEEEVDPKYQITAIVRKFDLAGKQPLILFENVKGYDTSVVCNVEPNLQKLAFALGVEEGEVEDTYTTAEKSLFNGKSSFAPIAVDKNNAPVKEVIIPQEEVDFYKFPVITHHMGEVPYMTRGVGVARDPEDGYLHAAYYRLMVKEKDHLVTHITPGRHLWQMYKKAEAMGQSLPIAFYLGSHPAWSMGVQSRISHPPTEFDVIGELLGEPLEMVKCETSDLMVPAGAEIVIEGELRPGAMEAEGPWRDFTLYAQVAQRHSFFVKCVTHRKDPILHDSGAWVKNGHLFNRIPQQTFIEREIQRAVPNVKKFRFGFYPQPMYGLISLDKKHAGEPKQAILAAFAQEIYLKNVAVFDIDIDLDNIEQITWAFATRVQADRDFLIMPGVMGTDLDISDKEEAVTTKLGIDATAKPFRKDLPHVGKVSEKYLEETDISKYL